MASVPAAGYPSASFGQPKAYVGTTLTVKGADELLVKLQKATVYAAPALKAALTEIGLFGEAETKVRTPVEYGVLRASIGHFDPKSLQGDPDSDPMTGAAHHPDPANAVFEVKLDSMPSGIGSGLTKAGKVHSVMWGTNVLYAPYIEDGFTMSTRRVVYIKGVGFRWVSPFSYRGAHMFELGLQQTAKAAPAILDHWVNDAWAKAGMLKSA